MTILLIACPILATAAGIITGKVVNGSTGQTVAGSEVTLLGIGDSAEQARTTTDAQGEFTLNAPASGQYVLRAKHRGVDYEVQVPNSGTVNVEVFDTTPSVDGISGTVTIFRINAGRNGSLHVSQMYALKNQSEPPTTQSGSHVFEISLPANGTIDSVLAAGPTKVAEKISATPVKGQPGHYTLNFPLRPGETNFAVNYDVPYTGKLAFHPRLPYGVQQFAVMFPQSMKFSSSSAAYHAILNKNGFEVQAATQVTAGNGPGFEISGNGVLSHAAVSIAPQNSQPVTGTQQSAFMDLPAVTQANGTQGTTTRAAGSMEPQSRKGTSDGVFSSLSSASASASASASWAQSLLEPVSLLLMSVIVAVLGVTTFLWRIRRTPSSSQKEEASLPLYSPLEAVKQEFMRLETARLTGAISLNQYNANKRVIERTMRRVLQKASTGN